MNLRSIVILLLLIVGPALAAAVSGRGQAASSSPAAIGLASGIVHGDTSVPDEKLIEQYGDKMPDVVFLKRLCKKMEPVEFHHKAHVERKVARCGNCHHKNPTDIKPCGECHVEAPEDPKAPKYQKAHHDLCHPCHKEHKTGDGGPPIKCVECHKKGNGEKAGVECPAPK